MKCKYCNHEIEGDSLFCPSCGKEVQFVSEHTLLEDEYIDSLVTGHATRRMPDLPPREIKQDAIRTTSRWYLAVGAVILVSIIIIAVAIYVKLGHENSYEYQVQAGAQAAEAHQYEKAASYYEHAIDLDPQDMESREVLADLYRKLNKEDAALVTYLDLIRLSPDNLNAYEQVIKIYEKRKDTESILRLKEAVSNEKVLALFQEYLPDEPNFNFASGVYDTYIDLTITAPGNGTVYYTMDQTDPIEFGNIYEGIIELNEMKTYVIRAVVRNDKGIYSDVVTNEYQIQIPAPQLLAIMPDGGDYSELTYVTISVPEGDTAYYTWDGTDPTPMSSAYLEPIPVPEGSNILSVVIYDPRTNLYSDIYRQVFSYSP